MLLMMSVPVFSGQIRTHLMYLAKILQALLGQHIWMMPRERWQMNWKKHWMRASSVNILNPMQENPGKWRAVCLPQHQWTADYLCGICSMMKREITWAKPLLMIPDGRRCLMRSPLMRWKIWWDSALFGQTK